MARHLLLLTLGMTAPSAVAMAQATRAGTDSSSVVREIAARERLLWAADNTGDTATYRHLTSPDLEYFALGTTRAFVLSVLRPDTGQERDWQTGLKVREYGTTAIVTSVAHSTSRADGIWVTDSFADLHVWIRRDNSWLLASEAQAVIPLPAAVARPKSPTGPHGRANTRRR